MLYKLAQAGFKPCKYFSIDRVFRNEAIDRTHLAEFHQIEGLVCDRGLTLGHLIGTLRTFFDRLGLQKLRFKPAFNPYTEPSMEIFSCALPLRATCFIWEEKPGAEPRLCCMDQVKQW
jgi:phenylalanyl-tRNA synthetase alpha chain